MAPSFLGRSPYGGKPASRRLAPRRKTASEKRFPAIFEPASCIGTMFSTSRSSTWIFTPSAPFLPPPAAAAAAAAADSMAGAVEQLLPFKGGLVPGLTCW